MAPIREGHADFRGWQTWYRVTGALAGDKLPLVVLHGGPGCTHDYVDSIKGLANSGRAVIHYDQLGSGRSTHLRDKGADFWTPRLFLDELENLTRHLAGDRAAVQGSHQGCALGDLRAFQPYAACRGDRPLFEGRRQISRFVRPQEMTFAKQQKKEREHPCVE